jgi:hypothetical protein
LVETIHREASASQSSEVTSVEKRASSYRPKVSAMRRAWP